MIGDLIWAFFFNRFRFPMKHLRTIDLSSKNEDFVFLLFKTKFSNRIFKNVVKNLVEDTRCEVHQTVLGIREGKEGWFEMFCLGGSACDDDGEMFSLMVNHPSFKLGFFTLLFDYLAQQIDLMLLSKETFSDQYQ